MRSRLPLFAGFAALLLLPVTSGAQAPVEQGAGPFYLPGCSIHVPAGDSWRWQQSSATELEFGLVLPGNRHSVVASVTTVWLGGGITLDSLSSLVRQGARPTDRKMTLADFQCSPDTSRVPVAVRYRFRIEDRRVPGAKGRPFVLEAECWAGFHPDTPGELVMLQFSERAEDGVPRAALAQADSFLHGLRLMRGDTTRARGVRIEGEPQAIAIGFGSLWACVTRTVQAAKGEPGTACDVVRVDAERPAVQAVIHVDASAHGLVATRDAIWVADMHGALLRVDPTTNRVAETVRCPSRPVLLAATESRLWITGPKDGEIRSMDLATRRFSDPLRVARRPSGLLLADGVLWVSDYDGHCLLALDPVDGHSLGPPIGVAEKPTFLAFGEGALWVTFDGIEGVQRIDPGRRTVVATVPGVGTGPIAFAANRLWCGGWWDGRLRALDPATNRMEVDGSPVAVRFSRMVSAGDRLWFADPLAERVGVVEPPRR